MHFFQSRRTALRLLFALASALPAANVGCNSSTETGTLMLGMSTNLELPDDIAAVGLLVAKGDDTFFEEVHGVETRTNADGSTYLTVDFPSTFAIRSPPGGQAHVKVRLVAYDLSGAPIVLRSAEVDTPREAIKLLRLSMDWMNLIPTSQLAGAPTSPVIISGGRGLRLTDNGAPMAVVKPSQVVDCDGGYDRQGGQCVTPVVASDTELEDFDEKDVLADSAKCFDVAEAFGQKKPLLVDLDSLVSVAGRVDVEACSFDPKSLDASANIDPEHLNVAVVTPQVGGKMRGKCTIAEDGKSRACFALLAHAKDASNADGWRYQDGKIRLPNGLCSDKFSARRSAKLAFIYGGVEAPATIERNVKLCRASKASSDLYGTQTFIASTKGPPQSLDVWPTEKGLSVLSVSSTGAVDVGRGVYCGGQTTVKSSEAPSDTTGLSEFRIRAGSSPISAEANAGAPSFFVFGYQTPRAWMGRAPGRALLPLNGDDGLLGDTIAVAGAAETLFAAARGPMDNQYVSQVNVAEASVTVKFTGIRQELEAMSADEKRVGRSSEALYGLYKADGGGYALGRYNARACSSNDGAECKPAVIGVSALIGTEAVDTVGTMIVSNGYVYFTAFAGQRTPNVAEIQRIKIPAAEPTDGSVPPVAEAVASRLTMEPSDPIAASGQCVYAFDKGTTDGTRSIICANPTATPIVSNVVDNLPAGSAGLAATWGTVFWGEPKASTNEGVVRCKVSN